MQSLCERFRQISRYLSLATQLFSVDTIVSQAQSAPNIEKVSLSSSLATVFFKTHLVSRFHTACFVSFSVKLTLHRFKRAPTFCSCQSFSVVRLKFIKSAGPFGLKHGSTIYQERKYCVVLLTLIT